MVESVTAELRDEFEDSLLLYVNAAQGVPLTKEDLVLRRGQDGNYTSHNLTHVAWAGFLIAKFGPDLTIKHLKLVTSH